MAAPRNPPLTPRIVALAHQGYSRNEIARQLGCTGPNVAAVLRRHTTGEGLGQMIKVKLEAEYRAWLLAEAAKSGVTASEMARAIIVDAINEERDITYGR